MLGEGTEKAKDKINLCVLSFHVFHSQYPSDASEIPSSQQNRNQILKKRGSCGIFLVCRVTSPLAWGFNSHPQLHNQIHIIVDLFLKL